MLHGWGIWIFRITMLVALALHILATIQLTAANRASRPSRYQHDATMVASRSSRMMIWSGLTVLVFFVFHILHYTVRVQEDLRLLAEHKQNWAMTIAGFQNLFVVLFYILSMALLCSHLVSWGSFYFPDTRPANKKDSTCGPTVFQSILHHHFCRIHLHSHQRLFLRLWKKGNGSHQGHGRGEGRRMPSQRFRVLSLTPSNTLN